MKKASKVINRLVNMFSEGYTVIEHSKSINPDTH